jgi:shikimate dehydrogenase
MLPQQISGDTRLVGLLGHPVAHSLSPVIHNHAFRHLQLPYAYVPLDVAPQELHIAVAAIRAVSFAGANVTIPHKRSVLPYCDTISELSRLTGTVNTLFFRDGILHGTTTDSEGFFRALDRLGTKIPGADVVILGNGGTARTLGFAVAHGKKAATLTLMGRNAERVDGLCAEIGQKTGFPVEAAILPRTGSTPQLERCSLLVNCTSVGMHPHIDATPLPAEALHDGMVVFDAIYNPSQTRLLIDAAGIGCRVANGLAMLLYQGLASFELWTGVNVSEDIFDLDALQRLITG